MLDGTWKTIRQYLRIEVKRAHERTHPSDYQGKEEQKSYSGVKASIGVRIHLRSGPRKTAQLENRWPWIAGIVLPAHGDFD